MTPEVDLLSAVSRADKLSNAQRSIALTVVALAFVMDLVDSTIVNVALPSMQTSLHFGSMTTQWVVAGYYLTFAMFLPTGGRFGDIFGYRRMFLIGVAGFTLASILCGATSSSLYLIFGRLLQGSMAALMLPQVTSMIQILYAPAERMKAMSVFGVLGGLSAVAGPVIGGLIIHASFWGWEWRPIFLINVPVGVIALMAGFLALPGGKSSHAVRVDAQGVFYLSGALLFLLMPLIDGRDLHWPLWLDLMPGASLILSVIFVRHIRKLSRAGHSPIMVPELFLIKSFRRGLMVNIFFGMTMAGYFLIFSLLLQLGLGYSALQMSVASIPFALGVSGCLGFVSRRGLVPGRYLIVLGAATVSLGLCALAAAIFFFVDPGFRWIVPIQFVTGLGLGCFLGPTSAITLSEVDRRDAGAASGIIGATQQLAAATGVAVIAAVFLDAVSQRLNGSWSTPQAYAHAFYLCLPIELLLLALTMTIGLSLPEDRGLRVHEGEGMEELSGSTLT